MRDFQWMLEYGINRFGSLKALEARLPQPATKTQLISVPDDRYLSLIALRVFRAGLRHSVVDAKWPNFEEVFWQFNPEKVVLLSAEHIERLMQDTRIIRHLGKLKSVPRNAQMLLDIRHEFGSFGAFLAQWPEDDIVCGVIWLSMVISWVVCRRRAFYAWPVKILLCSVMMLLRR